MKKIGLAVLCFVLAGAGVFAGGRKVEAGGTTITLLMRNMDEQFLKDYANNIQALAREKGVTVNLQDARSDGATQLTQLQTALNQGHKWFVIVPCVSELSEQMN